MALRTSTRTATGPTRRTRPGRADDNPPGLNLPGPSPVLDLRSGMARACRRPDDRLLCTERRGPGVGDCELRVTHAALNKDRGLIDPDTRKATGPTTPRGIIGDNFTKAVLGAVAETRRQWQDFGDRMI